MSQSLAIEAVADPTGPWRSQETQPYALPGKVPTPLNALIGREGEFATVQALLARDDVRLITLTGPGGVGKTRLAVAVAADVGMTRGDGVAFVSLAPVQDASLVPAAIADCLDVQESSVRPLTADLIARIGSERFLLVLDNFEHLLGAAGLVTSLLLACPGLQVLTTSRRRLDLSGEHEIPVPPLVLIDPCGPHSVEELAGVSAIRLFVARAQAAGPGFALTEANGAAVAEICQRLDGLPLAIELAAPRTRILSPAALLSRLTSRLQLLTGGPCDVPGRLQTMRQAIAWSYDLLDPAEQTMLRQLAIFVGGFTLEAAEGVAAAPQGLSLRSGGVAFGSGGQGARGAELIVDRSPAPPEGPQRSAPPEAAQRLAPPERSDTLSVLDALTALVDESLVQITVQGDGERRFGMLETVREYALERLAETGEERGARRRHATYCLGLAEHADPWQAVPAPWLDRLQDEHDNLRAALSWSIAHDSETALRLAGGLWRFWSQKGYWTEGRGWLEQALAAGAETPPAVRLAAIAGVGTIAQDQSDYPEARRYFEAMLALAHETGDERRAARALRSLGIVASNQSDFDRALGLFEEALARVRAQQDDPATARCLCDLGLVAGRRNDHERAIAYYEEALPLARASGDQTLVAIILSNLAGAHISAESWARGEALSAEALDLFQLLDDRLGVAIELYNLADAARRRGDIAGAWERYRKSQVIISELGERQLASRILDRIAHLLVTSGLPRPAAHLLGAAVAHRRELGDTLYPVEEEFVAETIALTRAALSEEVFQAAREAGEALSPDQAAAEAMAIDLPAAIADPHGPLRLALDLGLTTREVEVLHLVAAGQADKEIAFVLDISRHTASKHVAALRAKLQAPSRTGAVAAAREAGLL